MREIGSRLGVGSLLEGSVRKAGQRIRISARLIDARDGSDLWAERYERELDDIFAMQDEVCLSIASRLGATLCHVPGTTVVRRQARDPEANRLYLQARFFFNQRSQDSVRKSLEYLPAGSRAGPPVRSRLGGPGRGLRVAGNVARAAAG